MTAAIKVLATSLTAVLLILSVAFQTSATRLIKNPDKLVIAADQYQPVTLDPATSYESIGEWILQNVYETAWFYDAERTESWSPVLATALPIVSADGMSVTFSLKPGIHSVSYEPGLPGADAQGFKKWGPLTAEGVKYSMDRTVIIGSPAGPGWMYQYVLGADDYMFGAKYGTGEGMNEYLKAGGIAVDGPMTVSVHLTEPVWESYQAQVMMQPLYAIYSKECVEAHGGLRQGQANEWLIKHTCGTGPYSVTEWAEDGIVMEANPYWRDYQEGTYPKLATIVQEFASDTATRIDRLKQGDADFADIPAARRD